MDSNKRIWVLLAVSAVALAVPYFLGPEPGQPSAKTATKDGKDGKNAKSGQPGPDQGAKTPAANSPQPATPARTLSASEAAARAASQVLGQIETDSYVAKVSNLNGGLTSFALKGKHFEVKGKPLDIVTTDKEQYLPLAVAIEGWPAADARYELTPRSPRELQLALEQDGLRVTRKLEAGRGPFQLWVTTHVENKGNAARTVQLRINTYHYVTREAEGGNVPILPVRSSAHSSGLCLHSEELDRHDGAALAKETYAFGAPIDFTGVENVYFLSAVAPEAKDVTGCRLTGSQRYVHDEHVGTLFGAELSHKAATLAPGQTATFHVLAYLGPKSPDELAAAGHSLKQAIQSGWFTSLAEGLTWLLRRIYDFVGNWGLAIILLTFVVKLVLFPLTYRQMQSMGRMKELKPELDKINELYGDDREKKGAAIMELYRKRGVNPMAGCFPMLLQLPIWFSLYASLSSNVELFQAPFALWWTDLSSPDRVFVLPLALGALMFVQQKMTPASGMDPLQQKMMLYMMPTMMTAFMLFLPAGLCLYMFTNSALSIVQQRAIEARLKTASAAPAEPQASSSTAPALRGGAAADDSTAPALRGGAASPSKQEAQPSQQPPDTLKARPERSARPSKAERRWRRGKR